MKAWLWFLYASGGAFIASVITFFALVSGIWQDSKDKVFVKWWWKGE